MLNILSSSLIVSRILHAGYVMSANETRILFDPIFENPFSKNCYAFPSVQFDLQAVSKLDFDAVFISHFHDDHCSLQSLKHLKKSTPVYIYCLHEDLLDWIRQLGFQKVYSLQLNQSIEIGEFLITPYRALDVEVDCLFHIQWNNLNILNVVDSWIDYAMMEQLSQVRWDLILWPFQTMREIEVLSPHRFPAADGRLPSEWLEQLKLLNPQNIVPSSCQFQHEEWSWYRYAFFPLTYASFQKQMAEILPDTRVIRLDPSQAVALSHRGVCFAEPLVWIKGLGAEHVDYHYDPARSIPTTSEIAKHFSIQKDEDADTVYAYCENEIINAYRKLETYEDSYFQQPKTWKLSVYNSQGNPKDFYYRIQGAQIEKILGENCNISWTTEVPLATLYGALYEGESLTSMYLRINDTTFSPEIEKDLSSVDLLEDPLVRCLFTGKFGAYQKAQLQKLKKGST